jgi:hypothetical protein
MVFMSPLKPKGSCQAPGWVLLGICELGAGCFLRGGPRGLHGSPSHQAPGARRAGGGAQAAAAAAHLGTTGEGGGISHWDRGHGQRRTAQRSAAGAHETASSKFALLCWVRMAETSQLAVFIQPNSKKHALELEDRFVKRPVAFQWYP